MVLKDPRYEERFVYSYCALFGDVLADRALLDSSFPDALLEAYAVLGITGVWIHIVLYNLVPYPFDETLSRGWEIRQEGLRYLTEKLDRWGLRLFLYFNEPRAMPMAFFEKRPELLGMANAAGTLGTLCVSRPEVQAYLRDSAAMLAGNIPLLGGIFTITASENLTNCYSHVAYGERTACPRCRDMTHEESFALVNRLVWEGISPINRCDWDAAGGDFGNERKRAGCREDHRRDPDQRAGLLHIRGGAGGVCPGELAAGP